MWTKILKNIGEINGDSFSVDIEFDSNDKRKPFIKTFNISPGNLSTVDEVKKLAQDTADKLQAQDDLNSELKGLIGTQL